MNCPFCNLELEDRTSTSTQLTEFGCTNCSYYFLESSKRVNYYIKDHLMFIFIERLKEVNCWKDFDGDKQPILLFKASCKSIQQFIEIVDTYKIYLTFQ